MLSPLFLLSLPIFLNLGTCSPAPNSSAVELSFDSPSTSPSVSLSNRSPDVKDTRFRCSPYHVYLEERLHAGNGEEFKTMYKAKAKDTNGVWLDVAAKITRPRTPYKDRLKGGRFAQKWFDGQQRIMVPLAMCEPQIGGTTRGVIITALKDGDMADMIEFGGITGIVSEIAEAVEPTFLFSYWVQTEIRLLPGLSVKSYEANEQLFVPHFRQMIAALVVVHTAEITRVSKHKVRVDTVKWKTVEQTETLHAAHCDIKPENFLFGYTKGQQPPIGELFLTDFEFVTTQNTGVFHKGKVAGTSEQQKWVDGWGTEQAWSPEARDGKETNLQKYDVWSLCYSMIRVLRNPWFYSSGINWWLYLDAISQVVDDEEREKKFDEYEMFHTLSGPAKKFFAKCLVPEALRPDIVTLQNMFEELVEDGTPLLKRAQAWLDPGERDDDWRLDRSLRRLGIQEDRTAAYSTGREHWAAHPPADNEPPPPYAKDG